MKKSFLTKKYTSIALLGAISTTTILQSNYLAYAQSSPSIYIAEADSSITLSNIQDNTIGIQVILPIVSGDLSNVRFQVANSSNSGFITYTSDMLIIYLANSSDLRADSNNISVGTLTNISNIKFASTGTVIASNFLFEKTTYSGIDVSLLSKPNDDNDDNSGTDIPPVDDDDNSGDDTPNIEDDDNSNTDIPPVDDDNSGDDTPNIEDDDDNSGTDIPPVDDDNSSDDTPNIEDDNNNSGTDIPPVDDDNNSGGNDTPNIEDDDDNSGTDIPPVDDDNSSGGNDTPNIEDDYSDNNNSNSNSNSSSNSGSSSSSSSSSSTNTTTTTTTESITESTTESLQEGTTNQNVDSVDVMTDYSIKFDLKINNDFTEAQKDLHYQSIISTYSDLTMTDYGAPHWGRHSIAFCIEQGYFNDVYIGLSESEESNTQLLSFGSEENATRLEIVRVLANMVEDIGSTSYNNNFSDIDENSAGTSAIAWALENKITTGTGNGSTFSPNDPVKRQEMAMFFSRFVSTLGLELPLVHEEVEFMDSSAIWDNQETIASIKQLQQAGIIQGHLDGRFDPDGNITRAQFATMLENFVVLLAEQDEV